MGKPSTITKIIEIPPTSVEPNKTYNISHSEYVVADKWLFLHQFIIETDSGVF